MEKQDQEPEVPNTKQKKEDNDIKLSTKKQILRSDAEIKLSTNKTLPSYIQDLAKTYKEQNLTKQNLLYDLLHIHNEKVRSEYIYDSQSYERTLKEKIPETRPKKGILQKQPKQKLKKLFEYTNQDIQEILDLDNRVMRSSQKKRRISHILTAEFIKKYYPKTLARENDNRMFYYEKGVYLEGGRKKINEYVVQKVGEDYAQKILNLTIQKVEGFSYLWREEEDEFFETNPTYICLQNGILNLETYQLEEHSPDRVFFEKLPVRYEESAEYDVIDNFVDGLVRNEDEKKTLQEMFGYCLLRNYKYKKAFLLHGAANNGKSTILNILGDLLGKRNMSQVKLQDLSKRFQKRWIVNKLANIVADIPDTKLSETADFKGLTGQDPMMYEVKGGGSFTFKNHAKIIYSANKLPRVENATQAFYNRWVLVEFPYTFIKKKKYEEREREGKNNEFYKVAETDVLENFWSEQSKSGVLNWALKGLQRLERQDRFSQEDNTQSKWIAQTDSFKSFALEKLESASTKYIFQDHLDEVYTEWAKNNDMTIISERSEWRKTLEQMFRVAKKRKRVDGERKWIYLGVKFGDETMSEYIDTDASFHSDSSQVSEENVLTLGERLKKETEVGESYHMDELCDFTGCSVDRVKEWIKENGVFSMVDSRGKTKRLN